MKEKIKRIFTLTLTIGLTTLSAQNDTPATEKEELTKLSEAFGHFIGRNLKSPGVQFDLELIIKGMRDGAAGKSPPIPDEEYQELLAKYQAKSYIELSKKNLQEANEFLTANREKPGIIEIEEGKIQYQILSEGQGEEVKEGGSPQINFVGTLIDGTVFGNSEQAGGPITLPLDNTIPGFQKALVGMKEGEKRRLFIHPDMGYGTTGHLPPNSLLIFDIEVIKAATQQEDESPKIEIPSS